MKLTISNKIKIEGIDNEIKDILIDILRHKNPAYLEAQKQNKSTYNIPEFINNFEFDANSNMYVPKGIRTQLIDLLKQYKIKFDLEDKRILKTNSKYVSSKNINFRLYQSPAVEKLVLSSSEGILVAPPGSGKTVIGLSLIPILSQPTLWLTHTDRLLKQAFERCEEFLPGLFKNEDDVGMIGSGKWKVGNVLTIGMVQTLVRNLDKLYEIKDKFGLVILDECLTAGTKITMLNGNEKRIENVKNGEITTFGKITNKFKRQTSSSVKLRCSVGELSGTPTHLLPCISGNKLSINKHTNTWYPFNEVDVVFENMKNINEECFLLVEESASHIELFNIGKRRSRLLSLIACDGHIEKNLRCLQVGIVKDKQWFLSEMWYNTLHYDNHDIRISNCARGDLIIRSYSRQAIEDMNTYIPKRNKSKDIRIPNIIMNGSYKDIINYIQVAFDCKGSVTDQVTITMSSIDFIKDIQFLLRKFGIIGRLIPIPSKNHMRLAISGYDVFLFWNKIGFSIHRKQQKLLKLMNKTNKFRSIVNFRGISYRCVKVLNKEIINKTTTVYDFTTDQHLFIANGILSSNCHHCPASTFLKIISGLNSYYLYGLTATAYRRDGLEAVMFQILGPILSEITKSEVISTKGIISPKVVYCPLKTNKKVDINNISKIFKDHIIYNSSRNLRVRDDVVREAMVGNFCIVSSGRRAHCELLYKLIKTKWSKTGIATGKYNKKTIDGQIKAFNENDITVLITTPELLGEGFDVDFLNRLFIVTPFRTESRVEQLIGRIQRYHPNKKDAIVYDYVDKDIGVLNNQFYSKYGKCRNNVYRRLGIKIVHYNDFRN